MKVHMCWGCEKANGWTAAGGWSCSVYANPSKLMWARHNKECPFNQTIKTKVAARRRVGQQKQSKLRG